MVLEKQQQKQRNITHALSRSKVICQVSRTKLCSYQVPVVCVLGAFWNVTCFLPDTGEILFVPGGCPHYVQNLTTTLAISANFVDLSNFHRVLEELQVNSLLDPRAADLAQQFRQPSFLSAMKRDMGDLPWADFKTWSPTDIEKYCLTEEGDSVRWWKMA